MNTQTRVRSKTTLSGFCRPMIPRLFFLNIERRVVSFGFFLFSFACRPGGLRAPTPPDAARRRRCISTCGRVHANIFYFHTAKSPGLVEMIKTVSTLKPRFKRKSVEDYSPATFGFSFVVPKLDPGYFAFYTTLLSSRLLTQKI